MISGKITYLFHNAVDLESSSTTKADAVERKNINKSMGSKTDRWREQQ